MTEHLEKSQQEDMLQSVTWSGLGDSPVLAWALLDRRGRGGAMSGVLRSLSSLC